MPESRTIRIVWRWGCVGPYHLARMRAVARLPGVALTVIEDTDVDGHAWDRGTLDLAGLKLITLFPGRQHSRLRPREYVRRYKSVLQEARPDVIVEGYGHLTALRQAIAHRLRYPRTVLILWSETTRADHPRNMWKERLKSQLVRIFDCALVAGRLHAEYLVGLGLASERIFIGGGCVDNAFFASRVSALRESQHRSRHIPFSGPFFLYVGRLVPQKNLAILIQAYKLYEKTTGDPWPLVLAGDGPERRHLESLISKEHRGSILLIGNCQIDELIGVYAMAGVFVLPSLSEPWGLVVNEAMASGLPVLVSNRCGSAADLVVPGVTGWTFDPSNQKDLAEHLTRASVCQNLPAISAAAANLVGQFTVDRYAEEFSKAVSTAQFLERPGASWALVVGWAAASCIAGVSYLRSASLP